MVASLVKLRPCELYPLIINFDGGSDKRRAIYAIHNDGVVKRNGGIDLVFQPPITLDPARKCGVNSCAFIYTPKIRAAIAIEVRVEKRECQSVLLRCLSGVAQGYRDKPFLIHHQITVNCEVLCCFECVDIQVFDGTYVVRFFRADAQCCEIFARPGAAVSAIARRTG